MKKILVCLFAVLLCLTLSSCNLEEKREERLQALLNIETVGNYGIFSGVEYRSKNFNLYYIEYIKEILNKEKVEIKEDYVYWRTFAQGNRIFYYYIFDNADSIKNDTIFGYIDIVNDQIAEEKHLYLCRQNYNMEFYYYENNFCVLQLYANNNCKYIAYNTIDNITEEVDLRPEFIDKVNTYSSEYVINDKIYDIKQEDDNVSILDQETQEKIIIDYNYILERNDAFKQIHDIYHQYKKQTEVKFVVCNNEFYVYVRSSVRLMGIGELRPIVFKYDIEKDEFIYIGCLLYNFVSDIVNIVEIK